jgi:hypothetical protein
MGSSDQFPLSGFIGGRHHKEIAVGELVISLGTGEEPERKMKKRERERERPGKNLPTFTSSRSLLGRGDLRGTLGHQSNTLREERARLSYRLGFLIILWWEKGGWRGMGIRKNDCEGGMEEGTGHYWEGHWGWAASNTCCLFLALLLKIAKFALF